MDTSRTKRIRGQVAKAWPVAALPQPQRDMLASLTRSAGFGDDVDAFMAFKVCPPASWQPATPWAALPDHIRAKAESIRDALASVVALQHELPPAEYIARAQAAYLRQCGHELGTDRLRYILDRATQRDAGELNFTRPALWLDDADMAAPVPASPAPARFMFSSLDEALAAVQDKSQPTLTDRAFIWQGCFKDYRAANDQGMARTELRAYRLAIVKRMLQALPSLYRGQSGVAGGETSALQSLLRLWNQKFTPWVKQGIDALRPKLAGRVGRKGHVCPPCEKKIHDLALKYRGTRADQANADLAYNELRARKELCPACMAHWRGRRLARTLRQRVTPNAIEVANKKGRMAMLSVGPTNHCDWSDTKPGDRFVMDDMTTNEMAWDEVDGEIISGQVQLLATVDEASSLFLPFLMYFGAPNSTTIRLAQVGVFTNIGMPHVSMQLERGVFKNRLTVGEKSDWGDWFNCRETEEALRQLFEFQAMPDELADELRRRELGLHDPAFGLKIQHAKAPTGKIIEGDFGRVQRRSSIFPGNSGFNQRFERPDRLKEFDRRVKAGDEHPGEEYLHLDELRKNYEAIFNDMANRPVNGVRHRGRTPAQYWAEEVNRRPLRALPPEILPLLSSHRKPGVKVHPDGIRIQLDRFETAYYFNEHTGPLVERTVEVLRHIQIPDYIHFIHPDTGKILRVDRALTKRRTATPEEIAKVSRARKAHTNGALAVYGRPANPLASTIIRDSAYSQRDKEAGSTIQADHEAHATRKAQDARKLAQVNRKAEATGGIVPSKPKNLDRVKEGLDIAAAALVRIQAKKGAAAL